MRGHLSRLRRLIQREEAPATSLRGVRGEIDGLRYELRQVWLELSAPGLRCSVHLDSGADEPIVLDRHGAGTAPGMTINGERVLLGDPDFDHTVAVGGDPVLLVALLDSVTRSLVQGLVAAGGSVREGVIAARRHGVGLNPGAALDLLDDTLQVARRLRPPADLLPRLVHNSRNDPQPAVRALNLHVLASAFAARPETRQALVAALADSEPEIRIEAARRLGAQGLGTLRTLATAPETPEPVAARAIDLLGDALPGPAAIHLLRTANLEPVRERARALIRRLAQDASPEALDHLRLLLAGGNREVAVAVADSLSLVGPAAEPIRHLALADPRPEVRVAAATSLGHVGGIDSVPHLRQAMAVSPLDRSLARAARQAIAAIQARTTGSPGQLALADSGHGTLSFAPAPTGSLTSPE